MNDLILTAEKQGVFTITLNRLDKKNALNTHMYQQLCQYFTYAQESKAIHCLLIRGDDNCFCAGNDLQDFMASTQNKNSETLAALDFVNVLSKFDKPLVAAVAGAAVGIGTTLLLHCDMVIAANNSKFKLPFTQLGLCPEAGSSLLLPLRIGQNKAFELLVLGDSFTAEQAFDYGLVNRVCQPSELLATAESIALRIAKLPTDAVMTSRRLIRQVNQQQLAQVISNEGQEFSRLINTPDCKNILSALLAK